MIIRRTIRKLIRRPLGRFIHPADAGIWYRHCGLLFSTGEPQAFEVRLATRGAGATAPWVRIELALAPDDGQQAAVCRALLSDVNERKRAEEALEKNELRYRLLSEHAADVIWLVDLATRRFTYVSPSVFRLRGYTRFTTGGSAQAQPQARGARSLSICRCAKRANIVPASLACAGILSRAK